MDTTPDMALRLRSPALHWMPWYSKVLYHHHDLSELAGEISLLGALPGRLQAYESYILSARSFRQKDINMRKILGVDALLSVGQAPKISADINWDANWNPLDAHSLCSLMSGYRLVDIFAAIDSTLGAPSIHRTPLLVGEEEFPGMSQLHDWPKLLCKFRSDTIKSKPIKPVPDAGAVDGPVRLLRFLAKNVTTSISSKIQCNFIVAAFHLSCLKILKSGEDTVPELPDTYTSLIEALRNMSTTELSASNADEINGQGIVGQRIEELLQLATEARTTTGTDSLVALRTPLHLCALISPISLFSRLLLVKKSITRRNVLCVAHHLGNAKSDLLRRIENLIWLGLISLVNGDVDPDELMVWITNNMPWADIERAASNVSESGWFKLDRLTAAVPSSIMPANIDGGVQAPALTDEIPTYRASSSDLSANVLASYIQHYDKDDNDEGPNTPPTESPFTEPLSFSEDERPRMEVDSVPDMPPPRVDSAQGAHFVLDPRILLGATKSIHPSKKRRGRSSSPQETGSPLSPSETSSSEEDGVHSAVQLRSSTRVAAKKGKVQELLSSQRKDAKRIRLGSSSDDIPTSQVARSARSKGNRAIGEGKGINDIIDVDLYLSSWEPTPNIHYSMRRGENILKLEDKQEKISSNTLITVYDANGEPCVVKPSFHHNDYHTAFSQFMDRMRQTYVDGKPLHVFDKDKSEIHVISFTDFNAMSNDGVKALLSKKNVVVTGSPGPAAEFDEIGLSTLASMHSSVHLQDLSAPPVDGEKCAPINVVGTVQELLNCSRTGERILNGLDFPMVDAPLPHTAYTSDLAAWRATSGFHGSPRKSEYPTGDMRWGLASTAESLTYFHIDSDGFNTFLRVVCGEKLWGFYREVPSLPLSSPDVFVTEDFALDEIPPSSDFGIEALVLKKGDLLFMRPNTPHFAYALSPCIIHGGHYYMMALMNRSLGSLVHSFILNKFITNTAHHTSRALLRRMLTFCYMGLVEGVLHEKDPFIHHMPDVSNMDGLVQLLSLASLSFLGNVLDFRTYSAPNQEEDENATSDQRRLLRLYDRNNIGSDERHAMCHARGISIAIFDWVRSCCVVKKVDGSMISDLPSLFLSQLLRAAIRYKSEATKKELVGAPHCTVDGFLKQIENAIDCDASMAKFWKGEGITVTDKSLAFGPHEDYVLCWVDGPYSAHRFENDVLLQMGVTQFDRNWMEGEAIRFEREMKAARNA